MCVHIWGGKVKSCQKNKSQLPEKCTVTKYVPFYCLPSHLWYYDMTSATIFYCSFLYCLTVSYCILSTYLQKKCCQCTFLPTMVLLKMNVSLGYMCSCVYGLDWFRYKKKHLVWIRKTYFGLKYLLWSPQTNVKNVETQSWTVVSGFFAFLPNFTSTHPFNPNVRLYTCKTSMMWHVL